MANDITSWVDLLYSRDPALLRKAADLAERLGRDQWADAFRESAEACEGIDVLAPEPHQEAV